MKIKIDHVSKIEGHTGFVADIVNGNVKKAIMDTKIGIRLIEGILLGRHYSDAPIITSRICGICPVVHNLTSIKAIENAFDIKVSEQIIDLRKLMEYAQVIHSHSLHLFFLSFPDFLDITNDFRIIKKYPKETQAALKIRDFGNKVIEVIGGRSIHPINSEIGGFKKLPDKKELEKLLEKTESVLKDSLVLARLFSNLRYPDFERKTEYMCLRSYKEYAIYDGDIISTDGLKIKSSKFEKNIKEITRPYQMAKRNYYKGKPFMSGAIARLNNNYKQLNKEAKKILHSSKIKIPTYNTFHNLLAQAIEIVHCVEESQKILKKILKRSLKPCNVNYKPKAGAGTGVMEAPRGILYDYYKIDKDGIIKECNIITPTVLFLANLEEDLKVYIPDINKLSKKEREAKIRMLIRAYDPCISCATH